MQEVGSASMLVSRGAATGIAGLGSGLGFSVAESARGGDGADSCRCEDVFDGGAAAGVHGRECIFCADPERERGTEFRGLSLQYMVSLNQA